MRAYLVTLLTCLAATSVSLAERARECPPARATRSRLFGGALLPLSGAGVRLGPEPCQSEIPERSQPAGYPAGLAGGPRSFGGRSRRAGRKPAWRPHRRVARQLEGGTTMTNSNSESPC